MPDLMVFAAVPTVSPLMYTTRSNRCPALVSQEPSCRASRWNPWAAPLKSGNIANANSAPTV